MTEHKSPPPKKNHILQTTLTAMKKTKKANCGLKARWPQLEEQVHQWVLGQHAGGRGLSTVQLYLHAQVVCQGDEY